MTWFLLLAASAAVICTLTYALGMYLESGVPVRLDRSAAGDLFFVFLVPCLNEQRVLTATLDRLTSQPRRDFLVLVVDDGSEDATFAIADSYPDPRVRVLRRTLPDARKGKGAALNAAVAHLLAPGVLDHSPDRVVVGLVDADGRLDPRTVEVVAPYFADPRVGGVQVGVRIDNRGDGVLARLQDMEFVTYTTIFQLAHNRLGIAGLGGNGQFTRLEALLSLGPAPWSDVLTEDLDLGVRMQLAGWWTMHCPDVAVHQQGLTSIGRLIRQRSRWFQGNLQAWTLVPQVVRRSSGRAAAETLHMILMPVLILVSSLMVLSFAASAVGVAVSPLARAQLLSWPVVLSWYLLTFLPGLLFARVYLRRGERVGRLRAALYGHAFILYGLLWMAAGWWAVLRTVRGRSSWFKTERLPDRVAPGDTPGVVLPFPDVATARSQSLTREQGA
jgi:cellulose synthase/poly-beta-1,6-N-acetylglucosamine synthase-like glycosyltransferase